MCYQEPLDAGSFLIRMSVRPIAIAPYMSIDKVANVYLTVLGQRMLLPVFNQILKKARNSCVMLTRAKGNKIKSK